MLLSTAAWMGIGAGQEDHGEEDELHDGGGGVSVTDERCHFDTEGAKTGGDEYQSHEHGAPLVGKRHTVGPADSDHEGHFGNADRDAVRYQPGE
jgi:hypothetical protein